MLFRSTNVEVVCTLPEQLKFLGAKCSTTLRYRHEGRELIFEPLARLAPKADVIYRVQVRGIAPGDIRFRTRIKSDGLKDPVMREESTRIYSDDAPVRSTPSALTPIQAPPTPIAPTITPPSPLPAAKVNEPLPTPAPTPNFNVPTPTSVPAPEVSVPLPTPVTLPTPSLPLPMPVLPPVSMPSVLPTPLPALPGNP